MIVFFYCRKMATEGFMFNIGRQRMAVVRTAANRSTKSGKQKKMCDLSAQCSTSDTVLLFYFIPKTNKLYQVYSVYYNILLYNIIITLFIIISKVLQYLFQKTFYIRLTISAFENIVILLLYFIEKGIYTRLTTCTMSCNTQYFII